MPRNMFFFLPHHSLVRNEGESPVSREEKGGLKKGWRRVYISGGVPLGARVCGPGLDGQWDFGKSLLLYFRRPVVACSGAGLDLV